jgi:hypothetical protein
MIRQPLACITQCSPRCDPTRFVPRPEEVWSVSGMGMGMGMGAPRDSGQLGWLAGGGMSLGTTRAR